MTLKKKKSSDLGKEVVTVGIFFLFDIAELIILGLVFLHRNLFCGTLEILNN